MLLAPTRHALGGLIQLPFVGPPGGGKLEQVAENKNKFQTSKCHSFGTVKIFCIILLLLKI